MVFERGGAGAVYTVVDCYDRARALGICACVNACNSERERERLGVYACVGVGVGRWVHERQAVGIGK